MAQTEGMRESGSLHTIAKKGSDSEDTKETIPYGAHRQTQFKVT